MAPSTFLCQVTHVSLLPTLPHLWGRIQQGNFIVSCYARQGGWKGQLGVSGFHWKCVELGRCALTGDTLKMGPKSQDEVHAWLLNLCTHIPSDASVSTATHHMTSCVIARQCRVVQIRKHLRLVIGTSGIGDA